MRLDMRVLLKHLLILKQQFILQRVSVNSGLENLILLTSHVNCSNHDAIMAEIKTFKFRENHHVLRLPVAMSNKTMFNKIGTK